MPWTPISPGPNPGWASIGTGPNPGWGTVVAPQITWYLTDDAGAFLTDDAGAYLIYVGDADDPDWDEIVTA